MTQEGFVLLLFTLIPSLLTFVVTRAAKKRKNRPDLRSDFGSCKARVSCFTACSQSLLSVWSWCRQAATFSLKYCDSSPGLHIAADSVVTGVTH